MSHPRCLSERSVTVTVQGTIPHHDYRSLAESLLTDYIRLLRCTRRN